jgi:hypothetical protein
LGKVWLYGKQGSDRWEGSNLRKKPSSEKGKIAEKGQGVERGQDREG